MGLIDKVTELLPWRGERREPPRSPPHGVLSLREDLDRWLGRLLNEPRGRPAGSDAAWMPAANVHETDDELVVTVEVPGLDPGDLDLMITPGGLVIRGEKREAHQERAPDVRVTPEGLILREGARAAPAGRRDVYVAECHYGAFVRTVPLPPGTDLDHAEARVANGVLTVRFPKMESRPGVRRIPIHP